MQAAIAQHLNIAEKAIIKIEEWAHVLFVVARGLGGRFVSKKVVPTMEKQKVTGYELADMITDAINDSDTIYNASIWDKKTGETRVYVSYPSKKGKKDCGYVRVMDSGEVYRHLTLQAGTIEAIYSDVVKSVGVVAPQLQSSDPLTAAVKQIVEECWECGATYTSYGNVEAGNMSCRRCA